MAGNQNREQRRAAASSLKKQALSYPEKLAEVPRDQWPLPAPEIQRVLRSRYFLVHQYLPRREHSAMVVCRLSICRTRMGADGRWTDGITWDELQRIKAEAGYAQQDAVEVFPRGEDVVNVANMRHLWILAGLLPFAWRAASGD